MATNNHINYLELYSNNLAETKAFYTQVFGWRFTDYGPNYTAFENAGLEGGFEHTDEPIVNGALTVLFHNDLDFIKEAILNAGGTLDKDTFSYPGGERFEFLDPSGNKLAVWKTK